MRLLIGDGVLSYIIKRGLIAAETLTPFIDLLWESAPPGIDRHDPSTW